MKTYKEFRTLYAKDLWDLCIKERWYTRGSIEEYNTLFDRLYTKDRKQRNMTTEVLAEIAKDIIDHSEEDDLTMSRAMYLICKRCNTFFDEE